MNTIAVMNQGHPSLWHIIVILLNIFIPSQNDLLRGDNFLLIFACEKGV